MEKADSFGFAPSATVGSDNTKPLATQGKSFRERLQLGGESLTRPPRGYDPAHALIEDLKRKDFVASASFSEELACSAELLPWTLATFRQVAPLLDYLCAAQELEF